MKQLKNNLYFLFYTVILGAIVGVIVWGFLRVMHGGMAFLWEFVPSHLDFPLYTLCVCTAGGLLIGLWKRRFGDYPEELHEVIGAVKQTGRYPYHNVFSTVVSALLALLAGASVGPEAGLTGVIAGLCTWVGDKLKRFRREIDDLTAIGLSATLGTVFRSPMFGFMEPIESDKDAVLPKASKTVLYFAAILSSFGVFIGLNRLFGGGGGIESLPFEPLAPVNWLYAVPLTLTGIAAGYLFFIFQRLTAVLRKKLRRFVVCRAVGGGVLLGVAGTFLPLTMFSGEEQIGEVMARMQTIGAALLLVTAVVKLLLTNICIASGLKGGHFFPVIFCGVCIGCAAGLLLGISPVLCAAVVTTALVGHTLKKPLATVLLMMIVFPIRLLPVMLFAAMAARLIPTPKKLLGE